MYRFNRDRTNQWDSNDIDIVRSNFSIYECILTEGKSTRSYKTEYRIGNQMKLVIGYQYDKNVFIVWNADLYRVHDVRRFTVGNPAKTFLNKNTITDITPFYHKYYYNGKCGYEKILFVPKNDLKKFCDKYEDYIYPAESDDNFKPPVWVVIDNVEDTYDIKKRGNDLDTVVQRARDIVSRIRRNKDFRDRVLKRWNNKCAVCGIDEQVVLQAAHIIPVQDGGSDDEKNGVCLCANHHLMFDNEELLKIDFDTFTFACTSSFERNCEWYKEAEKRGLKLFLPNDIK